MQNAKRMHGPPWLIPHCSRCVCVVQRGKSEEIATKAYLKERKVSSFKRKLNVLSCSDQPQTITGSGAQFCIDNCRSRLNALIGFPCKSIAIPVVYMLGVRGAIGSCM